MSINMDSLEKLLNEFKDAFYADDLPTLSKLHSELSSSASISSSLAKFPCLEYEQYVSDLRTLETLFSYMHSNDWRVVRSTEEAKVECRGRGSEFFTKSTVTVASNIFQVLAVLSEAELVTTWVDPLKEVHIYSEPSKTRKLLSYLFDFPWPLSARHCILEFNAVPLEKSVMIMMKTPTDKYLGENLPRPNKGEISMKVVIGGIFVEYINEELTRLTFLMSADGNIVILIQRFLPNFLLNFGTKHIMYYMMIELKKKIQNVKGSVYEERINQKPEFYEYIRRMISNYVKGE